MPEIMNRVKAVKHFRSLTRRSPRRKSPIPHICSASCGNRGAITSPFLFIHPSTESTSRWAFLQKTISCTTPARRFPSLAIPLRRPYSAMHMAWMRQICGRLKSDYRYSNNLVYNNFPWPEAPSPLRSKGQQGRATDPGRARRIHRFIAADLYTIPTLCRNNS